MIPQFNLSQGIQMENPNSYITGTAPIVPQKTHNYYSLWLIIMSTLIIGWLIGSGNLDKIINSFLNPTTPCQNLLLNPLYNEDIDTEC